MHGKLVRVYARYLLDCIHFAAFSKFSPWNKFRFKPQLASICIFLKRQILFENSCMGKQTELLPIESTSMECVSGWQISESMRDTF